MTTPPVANPSTPMNGGRESTVERTNTPAAPDFILTILAQLQAQTGRDLGGYTPAALTGAPNELNFWLAISDLLTETQQRRTFDAQLPWQTAVLQQIHEAVIVTDNDQHVTWLNHAAAEQYGIDPALALGQPLAALYQSHWLQPQNESAAYTALMESGRWRGENIHVKHNGERIYVESTVSLLKDTAGAPQGMVAVLRDITERKQAEEQLRRSEERFRFLADLAETIRLTTDEETLVQRVIAELAQHLGVMHCSYSEVDTARELLPRVQSHSRDAAAQPVYNVPFAQFVNHSVIDQLLAGHTVVVNDVSHAQGIAETAVGNYTSHQVAAFVCTPLLQAGRWVAGLALSHDTPRLWDKHEISLLVTVSERLWLAVEKLRLDADLRASEAFNRTMLESSPDCLKVLDAEGRLLLMNGPGLRLMEIDDFAPLQNQVWASLWPADCQDLIRKALATARAGGQERFQCICPTAKGTRKWWDVIIAPVQDGQGMLTHFIVASRDITATKRTEEALRESETRLNTILQNMPASVYLLTPDQHYLYVNRYYERLANVTNAEIQGKSIYDMFSPETAALLAANDQRALAAKAPLALEESAPHEGELRIYASIKTPLLDANGEPYALLGISTDITERKRAERNQQFLLDLDAQTHLLDDTDLIMITAAQRLGYYLNVAHCTFNEIDLAADQGIVQANWRRGAHLPNLTGPYKLSTTMGAAIISTLAAGHSVPTTDVTRDPCTAERVASYEAIGVQSIVRAPFHLKGHWLAVLTVADEQPRVWRQDEIALLEAVIARTWPLVVKARAEAALRHSEERLRLATEAGGVGIFDHDLITNQTEFSAIYAHITGFPRDGVLTREAWLALVHPEDRSLVAAIWEQSKATGISYYYDCRIVRPDGALAWIEVNAWVTQDETGHSVRITGAIRDITERKQAALHQQFLLDLNAALRNLSDPTAIEQTVVQRLGEHLGASYCRFNAIDLVADKATLLAAWSTPVPEGTPHPPQPRPVGTRTPIASGCQLGAARFSPGYIAQAQAGRTLVVYDIHHDQREEVDHTSLIEQGFSATIRVPCLRAGQWVASLHVFQTTPRRWRADEVQLVENVVHHFWPLVEKASAEEALRRQEELVRQIADNIPGLIGYIDKEERYRFVNATYSVWQARPREAILGHTMREVMGETLYAIVQPYIARTLQGESMRYEQTLPYRDATRTVWITQVPNPDEQGEVQGFYALVTDISDRKAAEDALRQNHALLQSVLNGTPNGIYVRNREGRYLLVNQMGATLAGRTPEEMIGQSYHTLYPPETVADITAADQFVIETGSTRTEEFSWAVAGRAYTLQSIRLPYRDWQGNIVGILNVVHDITDRTRQERHQQFLSELGMQLRLLSDADAILGHLVGSLGQYLQLAGCRVNAIDLTKKQFTIQRDWTATGDIASGVYPLTELAPAALLTELGAGHTVVVVNTATDPHTAPNVDNYRTDQVTSLVGVPIFHQGQWHATLSVKGWGERDWRPDEIALLETIAGQITSLLQKVRAEEALRHSEERLRLALSGGSMGIWEWQPTIDQSLWNEEEYALFGLPPGIEITQELFDRLIHPADLPAFKAKLESAIRTGSDYTSEFRIIRPDGTVRWLAESVTVVRDKGGGREGMLRLLGINFDITERKRQERELHELNVTLEARVRERTAALEQANGELARSNRELEQFNYAAAHDLRSPLRGIANLVQWISEDAAAILPPSSQKHLALLYGRVKRMEQMLEDMLAYSRIGRVRYDPEQVDTQQVVHTLFGLLAPPAGFALEAVALPTLVTPRAPLEMVLRNLLSNAIKHHHQPQTGHVQVTARDFGEWLEFSVSDDGPGMEPEYHERIFAMFQTLKPRDQVEGSGIGLALVKKTVESYGGQIDVDSAAGAGATFRFTWPK